MNLNIKEMHRLLGCVQVNPAQILQILAVLAVLLSGHIKNGSNIFVAQIFLNKERKQMGREEMLFLHFLTTLLIQKTESILLA